MDDISRFVGKGTLKEVIPEVVAVIDTGEDILVYFDSYENMIERFVVFEGESLEDTLKGLGGKLLTKKQFDAYRRRLTDSNRKIRYRE
jgi:hypothetical protein